MLFRAILSCAALILALLLCLNANAAPACEDAAPCSVERPSKPLDIMKLMREQAASTRATEKSQRTIARPAIKRAPAAAAKAQAIPSEAATSFAAQPAPVQTPEVEVVTEDELNAIDRAGEAAPLETVGGAPRMQMPDADVSTIVSNGIQSTPVMTIQQSAAMPPSAPQVSWLQWLWSAVRDTFAALAAAVHHLIG